MTDLKNTLKNYLPDAQKGNTQLDEYLEVAGEVLDGYHAAIEDFKEYSDAQKIGIEDLEPLGEQFDITFPRNLGEDRKRAIVQDALAIFRSNGTERALKRIFRLIGWKVTIDYCWTLNPSVSTQVQYFYNGLITYDASLAQTYNTNPVSSPVGLYSVIFGDEVIYSNGTYADLYDAAGNTYPKNTIFGEEYGADIEEELLLVTKAPYIRINVNEEDYNLFTSDFVDPDTGAIHSYTATETFDITSEIIDFFLEQARPANVAILEIVTPFGLLDTIQYAFDDSALSCTYTSVGTEYDGTLNYGIGTDRYLLGENFSDFEYGTTVMTYNASPTPANYLRSYPIGTTGAQPYIPLWKTGSVDLTVPADCTVSVYTTKDDRIELEQGTAFQEHYGTYNDVTALTLPFSDRYAFVINITTPSTTGTVDLDVTLSH